MVPAWVSPLRTLCNTTYSDYRHKFAQRGRRPSESYLVAVRTRLYWPRVCQLCKIEEQRIQTSGYVAPIAVTRAPLSKSEVMRGFALRLQDIRRELLAANYDMMVSDALMAIIWGLERSSN